jgi:hypothetical protein
MNTCNLNPLFMQMNLSKPIQINQYRHKQKYALLVV